MGDPRAVGTSGRPSGLASLVEADDSWAETSERSERRGWSHGAAPDSSRGGADSTRDTKREVESSWRPSRLTPARWLGRGAHEVVRLAKQVGVQLGGSDVSRPFRVTDIGTEEVTRPAQRRAHLPSSQHFSLSSHVPLLYFPPQVVPVTCDGGEHKAELVVAVVQEHGALRAVLQVQRTPQPTHNPNPVALTLTLAPHHHR